MMKKMTVPSGKTILSTAASAAATAVVIRSLYREFLPNEFHNFLHDKFSWIFSSISSWITIIIDESEGLHQNQLFNAAEIYLGTKICPSTQRFRAAIPANQTNIILSMDKNQEVFDVFDGLQFRWKKINKKVESKSIMYDDDSGRSGNKMEISHFELSFHKKLKDMVFKSYLPHIVSQSHKFKEENKTLKIHTLKYNRRYGGSGKPWVSVNLDHPSTFETLAMNIEMKNMIIEDLQMFVRRKDFYKRVGKAWKRGYLLYGPPGTGKSSLIAAMANYLKFDIYDLELTDLSCNSDLRKLLIATANRSILVVEDIDCSLDLENRKGQKAENQNSNQGQEITLSGLLNFIDGLWSSCGDERIIIFTTNHKEHLDPALLRPGRMDVHIHMSYCTPCGFRMLASNYLRISEHTLFTEVEQLLPTAKASPAEVGEQLMKTEDPETALRLLVEFLKVKEEENNVKAISQEKESEEGEIIEKDEDGAKSEENNVGHEIKV
ncbi:hypothetical protein V2J09_018700 [Rumex salicifolius]